MNTVRWLKKTDFHYQWPEFSHIYLEMSNILFISETRDRIVFSMQFALLPEHADAIQIPGERLSFRHGNITFSSIRSRSWREKDADFFTSRRACSNKGIIMYLGRDSDGYLIYGDFGYLRIDCKSIDVCISDTSDVDTCDNASAKIKA